MRTVQLLDDLQFDDKGFYIQNLVTNQIGKIVRYTLKEGQVLEERRAPYVPVYLVIVKGNVDVTSEQGDTQRLGEGGLIVFFEHEGYTVKAVGGDVVLAGFLHWAASA